MTHFGRTVPHHSKPSHNTLLNTTVLSFIPFLTVLIKMYLFCLLLFPTFLPLLHASSSAAGPETLIGVVGKDFVMLGADSSISTSIALTCTNMDKIYPVQEQQQQRRHSTIVAAAAGDSADVNRMIQMLTSQATVQEYESCIGHDVEYISIRKESEDLLPESTSGLSVEAVARLARSQIAASLRSQTPYQVCMLVAGMQPCHHDDEKEEDDRIEACFSSHLQQQIQRASRDFHHNDVVVGDGGGGSKDESRTDTSTVTKDTTFVTDTTTSLPILLKPQLYWLDNYGALQKLPFGAHGLGANFLLSILDQGYSRDMSREDALSLIRECFRQLKLRFVMNSPQLPCIKCIDQHGCHVIQPAIANI